MKTKKLRQYYRLFNRDVFDNMLPTIKLSQSNSLDYCGITYAFEHWDYCKVVISRRFNDDLYSYLDTLLHEMIHVYQYYHCDKQLNHKFTFKQFADKIEIIYNWKLVK